MCVFRLKTFTGGNKSNVSISACANSRKTNGPIAIITSPPPSNANPNLNTTIQTWSMWVDQLLLYNNFLIHPSHFRLRNKWHFTYLLRIVRHFRLIFSFRKCVDYTGAQEDGSILRPRPSLSIKREPSDAETYNTIHNIYPSIVFFLFFPIICCCVCVCVCLISSQPKQTVRWLPSACPLFSCSSVFLFPHCDDWNNCLFLFFFVCV